MALLVAALQAQPPSLLLLAAALLTAVACAAATRLPRRAPIEVGVDDGGRLVARRIDAADAGPEHGLQCIFAAPWLITLGSGTMCVPIWPDSVPGNTFRRLWVHIRWSSGRQPVDLPAATAPGPSK